MNMFLVIDNIFIQKYNFFMKVSSARLKAIHVTKKEFKKTKNNLFINNCNGVVREVIDTIDSSSFLGNR